MSKRETKEIGDSQYKCRRCGGLFPLTDKKAARSEYGTGVWGLNFLNEWGFTQEEREASHREIVRVTEVPSEMPRPPDEVRSHRCSDGSFGIGDCIGLINVREVEKFGMGGWRLVARDQE